MKKILCSLALICLVMFNAVSALAEEIDGVEPGNAYIPENTVINLVLLDKLDSNINQKGDRVNFELKDDLTVENIVVVPKGTKLSGVIRKAHGSRIFNQSAVIRVLLDDVVLANGKKLTFKQDVKIKGGVNYANMAVGTAMGFVVPFSGMFFKGREIDCPPGTIIDYELKDNVDLGMTKMELVHMKSAERAQQKEAGAAAEKTEDTKTKAQAVPAAA